MGQYKECIQCRVALGPEVPVCYVCGQVQPGFEGATPEDLAAYEARLAEKEARPDPLSRTMVALMIGWVLVFLILAIILIFNQSLTGPGGPT